MKKIVGRIVGVLFAILLAIVLGVFGLQWAASERVEVVELHTVDPASGEAVITRLWVVDHEGKAYLRVGADGSGWYSRLSATPTISVTRQGTRGDYLAVPRPEKSTIVNDLMQAKYTWGDTVIGYLVGSRENSVPVELQPL